LIKMLCQVPRKQGMSETEFYPRYRNGHGGLVRSHAQAMGFLRYVQAHRIESLEIGSFKAGHVWREAMDGQSELWWESWDSMETALASAKGAEASSILEADEQAFTDTFNVSGFIAREEVVLDRSDGLPLGFGTAVKVVVDLWKHPDISPAEFSDRWRNEHAELVLRHGRALGICKYVQNHRDPEAKFDFAELRGWKPAPDGVTEMWWPSINAMRHAFASLEAQSAVAAIRKDEEVFTAPSLTRGFVAREHSIFDYIGADLAPR
jgi:EthD domain